MLPERTRRKADVVVSSLFILFGFIIIYRASQMPWATTRTGGTSQWFISPGLFPTVIGVLLILFSIRVLVTAIAEEGHRNIAPLFLGWLRGLPSNRGVHRVVLMVFWIGLYIFGAIGRINYQLASAIFLFGFIAVLWFPGAGAQWPKRLLITALISIIVPVVIIHVFSTYLYVPAP